MSRRDEIRTRVDFFRRMPLFSDLPQRDLARLSRMATQIAVPAGEVIMEEGTPGDALYVILAGEVEVTKQEVGRPISLAHRGPGEVLGEMSLLAGSVRVASVRAVEDSELLVIADAAFHALLQASPSASAAILRTIAGRLRSTEALLMEREKLASLGTLAAGLAHELNNPAAAIRRSADHLGDEFDGWERRTEEMGRIAFTPEQACRLEGVRRLRKEEGGIRGRDALALSLAEEEVANWLEEKGVEKAWDKAPGLVQHGFDRLGLEEFSEAFTPEQVPVVLGWLAAGFTVRELLAEITRSAAAISVIVAGTKSYAYLDQAPVQVVDLRESLESTLLVLAHRLSDGIVVRRIYGDEPVRVEGFGSELTQVWTHLVSNALDAMEGTGSLEVRIRSAAGKAEVEIIDSGPGIPSGLEARIFDPFFTTKPPGVGSGLGLHIAYNVVVNRHRGAIDVDSRPGRTVFRVSLPTRPTGEISVSEPRSRGQAEPAGEGRG